MDALVADRVGGSKSLGRSPRLGPHGSCVSGATGSNTSARSCWTCGGPKPSRAHRYCSVDCWPSETRRKAIFNRIDIERVCDICATPFVTHFVRKVHCSARCANVAGKRRQYASGSRRHFPRVRYGAKLAIAERDGWRCGFCHAVIDPKLRWPHPGSLSIDHIDPDGAHGPANWQASHLACNVQAGAKRAAA